MGDKPAMQTLIHTLCEPIVVALSSHKNTLIIRIKFFLGGSHQENRQGKLLAFTNEIGMRGYRATDKLTVHFFDSNSSDRRTLVIIPSRVFPIRDIGHLPYKSNLRSRLAFIGAPPLVIAHNLSRKSIEITHPAINLHNQLISIINIFI